MLRVGQDDVRVAVATRGRLSLSGSQHLEHTIDDPISLLVRE